MILLLFSGTNVERAKHILTESGMPLIPADDMDDAARKAVISLVDWCITGTNKTRGITRK